MRSKVGTVEVEDLEKNVRQNERHTDDGDHPPEQRQAEGSKCS
jgi:hypothetical protein